MTQEFFSLFALVIVLGLLAFGLVFFADLASQNFWPGDGL